jgi:hypothetical protein
MSYDLYFTRPRITQSQFFEYFAARQHCEVADAQVCYHNQDTGVYFLVDYNEEEGDPDVIPSVASLTLNYFRPHAFALEAVDEISTFVEHFGFSIHDPQNGGMGDGPFDREGFLKAWNHGNEFGYAAILTGENAPQRVFSYPTERLESIWKWNAAKASVQESLSEDQFVPRVFFMNIGGRVFSAAVWPDAISELVPQVDFLVIGRDELAPKSLFGGKKKDQILVPMRDLMVDLKDFACSDYALPSYKLPTPSVPEFLRVCIRKLKSTGIAGEVVPFDQILNEELVVKHRKG